MRVTLVTCAFVLAACAARAEPWFFQTPPAAINRNPVDADWRAHAALRVRVRCMDRLPAEPVLCMVFFQTKQDLWVKAREPVVLDGSVQTIFLRMDELSPDWIIADAARPFGRDLLRWVRAWGVEVFCAAPCSVWVDVSAPEFTPVAVGRVRLVDTAFPAATAPRARTPLKFHLAGFQGNPYNSGEISARIQWREGARPQFAGAYFRQDYFPRWEPGLPQPVPVPLGRPYWQADWSASEPGTYELTLDVALGDQRVREALPSIAVRHGAGPASVPAWNVYGSNAFDVAAELSLFARDGAGDRIMEYTNGVWAQTDTAVQTRQYWNAVLDWTPAWGHYTSPGEFDQRVAWRLERLLYAAGPRAPQPIAVFDDDVLDDTGKLNWRDHPLNRHCGGHLGRPFELFTDPTAKRIALDRARYLWRRFGRSGRISGLLFVANRPEEIVLNWITDLAGVLRREMPDIRILCNNPEFLPRYRRMPLSLDRVWFVSSALSDSAAEAFRGPRGLSVLAASTGCVGLVAVTAQHWAGADNFTCDIHTQPRCGSRLTATCLLRTEPNVVFQSRPVPLRSNDLNRTVFPLVDPAFWSCLQDTNRSMTARDLLNIREIGLRFFSDRPARVELSVADCTLNWPYLVDYRNRPALKIVQTQPSAQRVPRFSRFELQFDINRMFNNPYDPDEVDATIEFRDPKGVVRKHPAFYFEPKKLEIRRGTETPVNDGEPCWKVRLTPWETGRYDWTLTVASDGEKDTVSGRFECTPSAAPGFVQRSRSDPRYFEFTNGEFFYPIGLNLRSPADMRVAGFSTAARQNAVWSAAQGCGAYERWFDAMRKNGANYARVWMSPWWCGLEWSMTHDGYYGIGYYNQNNAARLDRILDLAERNGIYLCLETINHGCLSVRIDGDWSGNPLNAALPGGWVRCPTSFFHDDRAVQTHRNKLRYTVARWGYSPAVAIWGIITEAEWVEPYDRTLKLVPDSELRRRMQMPWRTEGMTAEENRELYLDWISETGGYIRQTDAHPHVVSVHFSNPGNGLDAWHRPNTDVVRNNAYTWFSTMWERDSFVQSSGVADVCRVFARKYEPYRVNKPLLIGEWGGGPHNNTENHLVAELHTGLWAIAMTSASGSTGFWWWNLVDARDLFGHFKSLAAFLKGEDRRGKACEFGLVPVHFPELDDFDPLFSRSAIASYREDELMAYIYCRAINQHDSSTVATGFDDINFSPSGPGSLRVPDSLQNGTYRLEYWNAFSGQIIDATEVALDRNRRRIPILSHRVDLAIKLKAVSK